MRNLNGTPTATEEGALAFGSLPLWFIRGNAGASQAEASTFSSGKLLEQTGQVAKSGTTVFQRHHIIPNQVYKTFKSDLKAIGWKQNDIWNLKKLPTPFHGNHPAYNNYIMNEMNLLKQSGNLNLNSMQNLQRNMRLMTGDAYRSGGTLNQYFKF